MRILYIPALLLVCIAGGVGMIAYDQWEQLDAARAQTAAAQAELDALAAESAALEKLDESMPVKYAADAVSEFVARALEAGEVLGAGVRIEQSAAGGDAGFVIAELKYGLKVAPLAIEAAAEIDGAPALFSMLEEEWRRCRWWSAWRGHG